MDSSAGRSRPCNRSTEGVAKPCTLSSRKPERDPEFYFSLSASYTLPMRSRLLVLWLLLAALLSSATAEPRRYEVDAARSTLRVSVGKGGLFSFAGHEHEVLARSFEGQVLADDAELSRSTLSLTFPAGGLELTGKGEPKEDVPKVQAKMVGPEGVDAARFPLISFRSTAVKGKASPKGGYDLEVTGDLSLHGVTKALTLPVHVELADATLTATGKTVLRHTDYGMKPISVAGVVKVKNELGLEFEIVARKSDAQAR